MSGSHHKVQLDRRDFIGGILGGAAFTGGFLSPLAAPPLQGGPAAPTVSVKDFNAVGDGRIDDTAAIQSAIDSVTASGGMVIVPPGVYLVSQSIELHSNTGLIGSGMGISILKLVDNHNGVVTGLVRTPYGEINHNVYVTDLTLDGNRENQQGGEQFGYYTGVTPDQPESDFDIFCMRVEARNFTGYGFDPHERTTRLYMVDCIAHHNGLDGFTADGIVDSVMRGCISYENDRHGFNIVTHTQFCAFQNCIARSNIGNGFTLQNESSNNMLTGNVVYQNYEDGIYVAGVSDNIISGNYVTENLAYGIRLRGCPRTTIIGNRLRSNSQRENTRYNEIQLDDDGNIGTVQCLVANNHITCNGDIRAKYGIAETPGKEPAIQSQNTFLSNAVFDAATSNYNIEGQNAVRQANA